MYNTIKKAFVTSCGEDFQKAKTKKVGSARERSSNIMKIEKIDIKYMRKDQFILHTSESLRHIKVLPWLSVVQSVEGSYDIALGTEKSKKTGSGGMFIAPSGIQQTIVHHVDPISERMRCRWIFLDVLINDAYCPELLYDFPTIVPPQERDELDTLFDQLFVSEDIFENYGFYYNILKILFRMATPKNGAVHRSIQCTLEYIRAHYTSEIRIDELAKNACMSSSNFYAVFKKQFGVSPVAYINRYRLSLAEEYLLSTGYSVAEIGNMVGIPDPLYFSKIFHKAYGLSPREFRTERKKDNGVT